LNTELEEENPEQQRLVNGADIGVTLIILAICGWLYYGTTTFEETSPLFAQDVPPELFPRLLLWLIGLLALFLPFEQRVRGQAASALNKDRAEPVNLMVYLTSILLIGVVASLGWIGIYLGTVLVSFTLPLLWGERRWLVPVTYVGVFPTAVAVLFAYGLKVHFDPGVLDLGFP